MYTSIEIYMETYLGPKKKKNKLDKFYRKFRFPV